MCYKFVGAVSASLHSMEPSKSPRAVSVSPSEEFDDEYELPDIEGTSAVLISKSAEPRGNKRGPDQVSELPKKRRRKNILSFSEEGSEEIVGSSTKMAAIGGTRPGKRKRQPKGEPEGEEEVEGGRKRNFENKVSTKKYTMMGSTRRVWGAMEIGEGQQQPTTEEAKVFGDELFRSLKDTLCVFFDKFISKNKKVPFEVVNVAVSRALNPSGPDGVDIIIGVSY